VERDRLDEQFAQPIDEIALRGILVRLEGDIPVPFDSKAAVAGGCDAGRLQFADAVDDALGRGGREKGEEMSDRLPAEIAALNTTQIEPSSFETGCCPPSTSMMLSRRMPSPTPGLR